MTADVRSEEQAN